MTKPKIIILDTNVILRYLLCDNEEMFRKANDFLERVRVGGRKAVVPDCVLTECVYVLMKFYEVPRGETAEKLQDILRYKGMVSPDRDTLIDALELFKKSSVDIVDCIVHQQAKDRDMKVFSFDADLNRKLPAQ